MDNYLDLDFTIDFETCSLRANAAVMQVAVVPWIRGAENDPLDTGITPFVGYVDLRTCVVEGFDFDPETIKWWSRQSMAAKAAVTSDHPRPIVDVTSMLYDWFLSTLATISGSTLGAPGSICLWCQGPDVDIAILRNLFDKIGCNLEKIIPHTSFRDYRTLVLEAALLEAERSISGESTRACGIVDPIALRANPSTAYLLYQQLPEKYAEGREAHDALYDARRSSWNTWQALKWMRGTGNQLDGRPKKY